MTNEKVMFDEDTLKLLVEEAVELAVQREREAILAVIGDNQCECRCSEVVRDRGQA